MEEIAALIAATALLMIGAAGLTLLLRPGSWLDAAIVFGIMASAETAVLIAGSGAVGHLRPGSVLVVAAALAAFIVVVASRRIDRPALKRRLGSLRTAPASLSGAVRRDPWPAAVVAIGAAGLAWQVVVAVLLPPYAFDALTYHLTIVATWLQEGNLGATPLSLCCANYPANPELMFAWTPLFLGTDALIDTVQVGFAVLAALAVAGLARCAGLGTWGATAAAGLFLATPAVLTQASTNYVDLTIAAWALAALYVLARFAAGGPPRLLAPAGLATGLVLGTKGTGVFWAFVLTGAGLILLAFAARRGRLTVRAASGAASAFVGCLLVLGSYWYARNWLDTGNPLYPLEVRAAGLTLFDGPIPLDSVILQPPWGDEPSFVSVARSWAADLTFWRQRPYEYQQRSGGLGPLWPWLGLPLLVPLTVVVLRRRSAMAFALLVVAVVFLVQPFRWWARFTLQLAAVGAVAIVAAGAWAPREWMRRLIRVSALLLALAGVVLSSYMVNPAGRAHPLPATKLVRLAGDPEARSLGRLFYPEYRFLEQTPEHATVVVDLRAKPVRFVYPLFGSTYDRRVIPAGNGSPPPGAWVVTASGRRLDREMSEREDFTLAEDVSGVRVWRPRSGAGAKTAAANARP